MVYVVSTDGFPAWCEHGDHLYCLLLYSSLIFVEKADQVVSQLHVKKFNNLSRK